tara:strand:+ start:18677 stop:20005 length:1329 start_codon:yes stop_codon:yes gene_type:complete
MNGGIKMETEIIRAKRSLGDGHWDKKLIANMVELSNADNYEEAKLEWIATGDVWWSGNSNERPSWVNEHAGKCLCGHRVVYHFKILNTENGNEECVGSEHIGSYLILREIKERTGLKESEITDEMIQQWINERTQSMIQTAWWHTNGEHFTEMFDTIKEADLRINVKSKHQYWCWTDNKYKIKSRMLKRGSGKLGEEGYQMSSIVWRWNHPENGKNQSTTRGYPNDKLWNDLVYFHAMYLVEHKARVEAEDARLEESTRKQHEYQERQKQEREERQERQRLRDLEWEKQRAERLKLHRQQEVERQEREKVRQAELKISNGDKFSQERELLNDLSMFNNAEVSEFTNMCDYYGLPVFDGNFPISIWESSFLIDIRRRMASGNELSVNQLKTLKNICSGEPATTKQVQYLENLGYEGSFDGITKRKASIMITNKKQYDTFEGEK